jgi:hypothetical protein
LAIIALNWKYLIDPMAVMKMTMMASVANSLFFIATSKDTARAAAESYVTKKQRNGFAAHLIVVST